MKLSKLFSIVAALAFVLGLATPAAAAAGACVGGSCYATIQEAVDAAVSGDTINISAGTYVGEVEIVGKDLTLIGGAGVVIQSPAILDLDYTNLYPRKSIVFIENATVTLDGITLNGAGLGNANNRFTGIIFHNAGGAVLNSTITGVRDTPFSGAQHGVGLYADNADGAARSILVDNNVFVDNQKGDIALTGAGLTVTVTNNTITGVGPTVVTAQNGIQISGGATGTIAHNTVSGYWYSPATWSAAGILLFGPASGTFIVDGNTLTNNQTQVYAYQANAEVMNNILVGGDWGIDIFGGNSDPSLNPLGNVHNNILAGVGEPFYMDNPASIEIDNLVLSAGPETITIPAGVSATTIQGILNSAVGGDTIILPAEAINVTGGFTLVNPGTTVVTQSGTIINASSPCFTVAADDVTISGPGLCNPSGASSGVEVNSAVAHLIVDGLEFNGVGTTGSAILINAAVDGLKIVNNNIHDFTTAVHYTAAGVVSGVATVQGNLFLNAGFLNESGVAANAEYNAWGSATCPALTDVDADPCTHAAVSMINNGAPQLSRVLVGRQITYTVQLDAVNVIGADFDVDLSALLPYASIVSVTNGTVFDAYCGLTNTAGVISYCGISTSKAPVTGLVDVFTVVLQGTAATSAPVALTPDASDDAFSMMPGYGDSTNLYATSLTGGTLEVMANYAVSGTIDLQGRVNESGATVSFALGAAAGFGPFSAASDAWGGFALSELVADTYPVSVSMAKYLDVPARAVVISADKVFSNLVLWGGDADDDNDIDLSDAGIVGGVYGSTAPAGDINGDGKVTLNDLTLVGGNYNKTSADYTWVP